MKLSTVARHFAFWINENLASSQNTQTHHQTEAHMTLLFPHIIYKQFTISFSLCFHERVWMITQHVSLKDEPGGNQKFAKLHFVLLYKTMNGERKSFLGTFQKWFFNFFFMFSKIADRCESFCFVTLSLKPSWMLVCLFVVCIAQFLFFSSLGDGFIHYTLCT